MDALVTQEFLDESDIFPIVQQMGGETLAQDMVRHSFLDACLVRISFDDLLDTVCRIECISSWRFEEPHSGMSRVNKLAQDVPVKLTKNQAPVCSHLSSSRELIMISVVAMQLNGYHAVEFQG